MRNSEVTELLIPTYPLIQCIYSVEKHSCTKKNKVYCRSVLVRFCTSHYRREKRYICRSYAGHENRYHSLAVMCLRDFVKHDLKGVLKYKARNLDPPPPHRLKLDVTDSVTDRDSS